MRGASHALWCAAVLALVAEYVAGQSGTTTTTDWNATVDTEEISSNSTDGTTNVGSYTATIDSTTDATSSSSSVAEPSESSVGSYTATIGSSETTDIGNHSITVSTATAAKSTATAAKSTATAAKSTATAAKSTATAAESTATAAVNTFKMCFVEACSAQSCSMTAAKRSALEAAFQEVAGRDPEVSETCDTSAECSQGCEVRFEVGAVDVALLDSCNENPGNAACEPLERAGLRARRLSTVQMCFADACPTGEDPVDCNMAASKIDSLKQMIGSVLGSAVTVGERCESSSRCQEGCEVILKTDGDVTVLMTCSADPSDAACSQLQDLGLRVRSAAREPDDDEGIGMRLLWLWILLGVLCMVAVLAVVCFTKVNAKKKEYVPISEFMDLEDRAYHDLDILEKQTQMTKADASTLDNTARSAAQGLSMQRTNTSLGQHMELNKTQHLDAARLPSMDNRSLIPAASADVAPRSVSPARLITTQPNPQSPTGWHPTPTTRVTERVPHATISSQSLAVAEESVQRHWQSKPASHLSETVVV